MADLGNLTKKVAGKVGSAAMTVGKTAGGAVASAGKAVGGVVSSLAQGTFNTIKSGIVQSTGINALRPSNVIGGVLDSVGLGAMRPAFGGDPTQKAAAQAANRVVAQNNANTSLKPLEELLQKLLTINEKILENTNSMLSYAKKQSGLLDTANDLVKKQMLQDIENARVAAGKGKVGVGTPANDNTPGKKPAEGGFLSGILGSIMGGAGSLLKMLGPIGEFLGSIGRIFLKLGRFTMLLNPYVLAAEVILLSLKAEDWASFFDNIGKIFGALAEGKFLEAFTRSMLLLPELILRGLMRIAEYILEFFGFEDLAKKLSKFIDSFDLYDILVNSFKEIVDVIMNIGSMLVDGAKFIGKKIGGVISGVWDTISNAFGTLFKDITDAFDAFSSGDIIKGIVKLVYAIPDALIQWVGRALATVVDFFGGAEMAKTIRNFLDNFNLTDTILKFFTSVKEYVTDTFASATKAFSDWWKDFHPIDDMIGTFSSIKDWITSKFTDTTKAFSQWWDSFSIIDIVLTPFNYLKDTATALFDNLQKSVADVLSFDLVKKVSDSISSVVSGVWDFFKALPSKAVDLISDLIPDSLKGFFKSMFGSSTTPTATPTTPPVTQPRTALTPQSTSRVIQEREDAFNATPTAANVSPVPTGREQVFNQQSARMSVDQAAPTAVIINNNNNSPNIGSSGQNSLPRTSGAVQTAPQSSHIDRALYGDTYGAGVP